MGNLHLPLITQRGKKKLEEKMAFGEPSVGRLALHVVNFLRHPIRRTPSP